MTLIDRLSQLDGPDREVDSEIAVHLLGYTRVNRMEKWPEAKPIWDFYEGEPLNSNGVFIPKYTSSVDAAIALAERVLPGWTIARLGQDDSKLWNAELRQGYLTAFDRVTLGGAPNGAIALCIALLRAKDASRHGE